MTPAEELVLKYDGYSDSALFEIHSNIEGYSKDAKEALDIVLERRGGLEGVQKRLAEKRVIHNEMSRVAKEASKLVSEHTDIDFIKTLVGSDILQRAEVDEIVKIVYESFQNELKDKAINSRTIFTSLIGTLIASIIGGIIWGLQLITMARIFILLVIGIAIINYGIIRLVTKKSKQNIAVFIAVIVSVVLSISIGQLLYDLFGYQGAEFLL